MRYGSGGQGKDSGNELNVENKKQGTPKPAAGGGRRQYGE